MSVYSYKYLLKTELECSNLLADLILALTCSSRALLSFLSLSFQPQNWFRFFVSYKASLVLSLASLLTFPDQWLFVPLFVGRPHLADSNSNVRACAMPNTIIAKYRSRTTVCVYNNNYYSTEPKQATLLCISKKDIAARIQKLLPIIT